MFLSTTEVAVQQLAMAMLWAARMQQIERELQYRCGSGGDSVMGSNSAELSSNKPSISSTETSAQNLVIHGVMYC